MTKTNMVNLIDEVASLKQEYQDKCKSAFKDILKDYFERTNTQAIVWAQYVPGFNDGDPCEFSLTDVVCITDGFDKDNIQDVYEYDDDESYKLDDSNESKALISFLVSNEGMLEDMFGSHVMICVTPDEIITEEYDCGY